MIKKIILISIVASQFMISCTKEESSSNSSNDSLNTEIAAIIKLPYSALTPDQQKVKLEAESNEMLVQMNKSKSSGAIEAMQNLGNLLSINSVDIFDGKNDNQIADILNVSGVYGIYTWSNSKQFWVKSASTTELKFIFPSKKNLTTNNASLSSKSTSSNIKVKLEDTFGSWVYNPITGDYTQSPSIDDEFYLPTSIDAILTIDNAQAATISANSSYSNGIKAPDSSSFKIVLNDGYVWEISGKKATENVAKSSFTYNGNNLLEFTAGSTANINGLLEEDNIEYQGKANGLIKILDNFIIVAEMDLTNLAKDEETLNNLLVYPDYNTSNYYADLNTFNKKESEGEVATYNKNIKLVLVSKKDGTKIADLVQRSEKGYSYTTYYTTWNGNYWAYNPSNPKTIQNYENSLYLRFNDNTEVEISAYFSTGFDDLVTKFEDFLKAFDRY